MTGHAVILQGDALALPLPDESVDLIVTSPPYFALRSYQDGGEHYEGQVGSEESPRAYVAALVEQMRESVRVLRPWGSIFVNLGDKYAGSGSHNNAGLSTAGSTLEGAKQQDRTGQTGPRRNAPTTYNKSRLVGIGPGGNVDAHVRDKSLMGLPWRFAIACTDELGLVLRAEIIWAKRNGLPESVDDRVRRTHEQWFHFVKAGRYHSAIDEIRGSHAESTVQRAQPHRAATKTNEDTNAIAAEEMMNAKGALPPSVWSISTEALRVPEFAIEDERGWRMFGKPVTQKQAPKVRADLWAYCEQRHAEGCESLRIFRPDHFAAFPTEWPRRLILGWAPHGVCTACGQPRKPYVSKELVDTKYHNRRSRPGRHDLNEQNDRGYNGSGPEGRTQATILGYVCDCTPYTNRTKAPEGEPPRRSEQDPRHAVKEWGVGTRGVVGKEYHLDQWEPAPTRQAVILDPFGGTGTVAMIAKALGHVGVSIDLSLDYTRLARWRVGESGHGRKARDKTWGERQGAML